MFRLFQEDLRASDADREQVAEVLKSHYAVGRLTSSELSARVEAAYSAVGLSELDALTRDLPPLPLPPARTEPAGRRRVRPLVVALAGLMVFLVIAQAIPAEMWTLLIFFGLPILMMALFGLLPFALPVLAVAWLSRSLDGPPAQPRRLGAGSGRAGPWHVAEFEHHPRSRARRGWVEL